jgi:hypothetical protein
MFYNPWEEIDSLSIMFGAPQMDDDNIEEDLCGREEMDEEEKEDVPAANTPTDEEEEDDDDDELWLWKGLSFFALDAKGGVGSP